MIRALAHRTFQRPVVGGADGVMAAFALPSDTVVHSVRGYVNVEGVTLLTAQEIAMCAVEAHVLPVLDPDGASIPDTVWDTLVMKDSPLTTLDLDTGSVDASPVFEPGETQFARVLDVGLQPKRLMHQHRMFSLGNGSLFQNQDNQTPFAVEWIPGGRFNVNIGGFRVSQPSYVMVGVAAPTMDRTTTTIPGVAVENDWPRLKYLELVLEQALISLMGLVEAGAETPWEEATTLLKRHLDPEVFESDGDQFQAATYSCFGEIQCDMSVPGTMDKANLMEM